MQATLGGGTTTTSSTTPSTTGAGSITADMIGQLQLGASGDRVCYLQAVLAADPDVYPEGRITCYFGPLTMEAVKKFQAKKGFERAGSIGPKTLEALREHLKKHPLSRADKDNEGRGHKVCAIVPPGHLIAPGWLKKHDGVRPIVPPCQKLPPGIGGGSGTSTTTPDTTAPSISALSATSVGSTTGTISWTASEAVTGKVYYSTTTPISLSSALTVSTSTLSITHSFSLTNLVASTTYDYVAESTDAAGNTATSSSQSFTTGS